MRTNLLKLRFAGICWSHGTNFLSKQTVEKRSGHDQGNRGGEREAERGAEKGCRKTQDDRTDGAHALIEIEHTHHSAHEIARRFDLDDHAADGAETYLTRADQSEEKNGQPKDRRYAKEYEKNRRRRGRNPEQHGAVPPFTYR